VAKALTLLVACLLLSPGAHADLADLLGNKPAVLSPQQAFAPQLVAGADGRLQVQFRIAPGHYLYRDSLQLTDAGGAALHPELPAGEPYDDPESGPVTVLRGQQSLALGIPAQPGAAIGLRYQGCAQGRLCYAPVNLRLQLP
jgi:thiol:disulfide interchange protein DsbD